MVTGSVVVVVVVPGTVVVVVVTGTVVVVVVVVDVVVDVVVTGTVVVVVDRGRVVLVVVAPRVVPVVATVLFVVPVVIGGLEIVPTRVAGGTVGVVKSVVPLTRVANNAVFSQIDAGSTSWSSSSARLSQIRLVTQRAEPQPRKWAMERTAPRSRTVGAPAPASVPANDERAQRTPRWPQRPRQTDDDIACVVRSVRPVRVTGSVVPRNADADQQERPQRDHHTREDQQPAMVFHVGPPAGMALRH